MNGQAPQRREWKELIEEIVISIHNTEIQLALLKAQLKEALTHEKGV